MVNNMKSRVVKQLKEAGIRRVNGKKVELYNFYTLTYFVASLEKDEVLK